MITYACMHACMHAWMGVCMCMFVYVCVYYIYIDILYAGEYVMFKHMLCNSNILHAGVYMCM